MFSVLAGLHVVVAVLLILFVLIQDSKGGTGMFSGGGSNTILGATGATNLLVKVTRVLAILFACTCIGLTVYTAHQSQSVVEGVVIPTKPVPPVDPAAAPEKTETAPAQPKK